MLSATHKSYIVFPHGRLENTLYETNVTKGARTLNRQSHNLTLYQLSYSHSAEYRGRTYNILLVREALYRLS